MKKQLSRNYERSLESSVLRSMFLLLTLLITTLAYPQLDSFELSLTKTDETCLGNGTLTFSVDTPSPTAVFLFTVYKFPNLNVPVSVTSSNSLSGLNAGTYKVVATQTVNDLINSDEEQIVIESAISPLEYSIDVSNQNCSQGAQITLNATVGSISQCEIISGPELRPLQTSTVFSNLQEGTYNIRAFNSCGEAVVTTYTVLLGSADLAISEGILSNDSSSNCDMVNISNMITPAEGTTISYPITIAYTIHPPGGANDIVVTQQIPTGMPGTLEVSQEFQIYEGEDYTYDMQVTDNCNVVFNKTGMVVNAEPQISFQESIGLCGKYFQISMTGAKAPFTVNFINAPAEFDAEAFNSDHPGPFNTSVIQYGSQDNHLPSGVYKVEITDSCGRVVIDEYNLEQILPVPSVVSRNNGCFADLGNTQISISGRIVVSGSIISAPEEYTESLPQDVNGFIVDGKLKVLNLPIGTYEILVVDSCGNEYTVVVEIPVFVERDFVVTSIPFCAQATGSVQITSGNGKLTSLAITSAPSAYTESLPFDVTDEISSNGKFFMSGLPEGSYTFAGTDECGIQKNVTIEVTGYHPDAEPFLFVPNCGAFDIVMSDNETGSEDTAYWMQKMHPLTGQWGHPVTGAVYNAGLPDVTNSYQLANNSTAYNLLYQGKFRIVKSFKSYGTGVGEQYCIEIWEPFTFDMDLKIGNAFSLGCTENPNDVYVEALNGLAPYTYRIVAKDGNPFIVENGENNIFSNLEPGVYKFEVTDACQSIVNKQIDINQLPSLAQANLADDMLICTDSGTDVNQTFDLAGQNAAILGDQHPELYTVTYHLSLEDADSNSNPLPAEYSNISNPQTIYARVVHNHISICHDVTSFELHVNENPTLDAITKYMCENEPVWITASGGFDSYEWSTGETSQSILVDAPGTYTVKVRQIVGSNYCEGLYDINVTTSGLPTNVSVDTQDWTYDQNTIAVSAIGPGNYEYSLDGVTFQDQPQFTNLTIGDYTIYIRDKNGCGLIEKKVLLLNYPNFFTPNGDGTHDKWRIKYAYMEPDMEINIFDRYGKLIISLDPESDGWDGTYNGSRLPSTDYWFVVSRSNGQVHKGHFSMLR